LEDAYSLNDDDEENKVSGSKSEGVVYVAEVKNNKTPKNELKSLISDIKQLIIQEYGLSLEIIILVKSKTIPKTTSGKIARKWCYRAYHDKTFQILMDWNARENRGGEGDEEIGVEESKGNLEIEMNGQEHEEDDDEEDCDPTDDKFIKLQELLVSISPQLSDVSDLPTNLTTPLIGIGVDSMTIAQYKGVLISEFNLSVPDEYLFSELCSLKKLWIFITYHNSSFPEKEMKKMNQLIGSEEDTRTDEEKHKNSSTDTSAMETSNKNPCCPWFYCCY